MVLGCSPVDGAEYMVLSVWVMTALASEAVEIGKRLWVSSTSNNRNPCRLSLPVRRFFLLLQSPGLRVAVWQNWMCLTWCSKGWKMLLCRQELWNGRDKHHSRCPKIRRYQCAKCLFKGVRYHMGSSESIPVTETKVDYIPGYLYITNKRIIFTSQKGGLEKTIGSLSAFHPYSNAIGLQFGQKVINFILPRADLAVQTLQIMT